MRRYPLAAQILALVLSFFLTGAANSAVAAPNSAAKPPAKSSSKKHHRGTVDKAVDPTKGDIADYDDPVIRQLAVERWDTERLGARDGSDDGTHSAIVNQKMAFSAGFEPCSTIKPVIALAGLQEGVITRDTMIEGRAPPLYGFDRGDGAFEQYFFEKSARELGFPRVHKYAICWGWASARATTSPKNSRGSCRRRLRRMAAWRACRASAKAFG